MFTRLVNPAARMEAITARPFLLSGVARLTNHAGQQHLSITGTHGKGHLAQAMLMRVSRQLQAWKSTAEQLTPISVWERVCEFIIMAVTGFNWLTALQARRLPMAGAG